MLALAAERAGMAKNEPDDDEIRRAKDAYTATLRSINSGMAMAKHGMPTPTCAVWATST
jgi:hypothetical protein